MKKKTFIVLIMSVIGGMLFALGMCMCLLPEWEVFNKGVILGVLGAIELLITWLVYRKMSGKTPIKLNAKIILRVIYGILSAMVFGTGMCMIMVFQGLMVPGIIVGIVGIILLLCLIPMCVGFKEENK